VYGVTELLDSSTNEKVFRYYLSDGVYGSFNNIVYDHATLCAPLVLDGKFSGAPSFRSLLFGPTCDGFDLILQECELPELKEGKFTFVINEFSCCVVCNKRTDI